MVKPAHRYAVLNGVAAPSSTGGQVVRVAWGRTANYAVLLTDALKQVMIYDTAHSPRGCCLVGRCSINLRQFCDSDGVGA